MLKTQINLPPSVKHMITWTWRQFCFYLDIPTTIVEGNGDLVIGREYNADVIVSDRFIQSIEQQQFHWKNFFEEQPIIRTESGEPDLLSTCFYMINCVQEYGEVERDQLGRFKYSESYQYHFDCVQKNLVGEYFDHFYDQLRARFNLPDKKDQPSQLFLSHDIDNLYGSATQDTFNAIKRLRLDWLLKIAQRELRNQPSWFNISDILELEKKYGCQSTFFWLPVKGKGVNGLKNADYDIRHQAVQDAMRLVEAYESENGIHKAASNYDFQEEMKRMGQSPVANRYHFLRFFPPNDFSTIEKAGIQVDSTLGFAEVMGFRNNFALPFQPYNLAEDRPYQFVEMPLHIMDTSFRGYQKQSPGKSWELIESFLDKHRQNAIISVLWHNPFFTDMKFSGWREVYEGILKKGMAHQMSSINPAEIAHRYFLEPGNA